MTKRSILLDEGANRRLVPWLRAAGWDVSVVSFDYPAGIDDREILEIARREDRIVITNDADFGELIVRHGMPHAGVILLRLRSVSFGLLQARLAFVLTTFADRLDCFLTVTEDDVRVR